MAWSGGEAAVPLFAVDGVGVEDVVDEVGTLAEGKDVIPAMEVREADEVVVEGSLVPQYGAVPVYGEQDGQSAGEDEEDGPWRQRLAPRWETPRRRGTWTERWPGARALGADSVPIDCAERTVASLRSFLAKSIQINVGVPAQTVEQWLRLLGEYLELSADENVLMITLFRKYVLSRGPLVRVEDFSRPQKWECVLALCAYFAVLLSEEFAGGIARDLRELLGPGFHFGAEQAEFLRVVSWRINISEREFTAATEIFGDLEPSTARASQWLFAGRRPGRNAQDPTTEARSRKRAAVTATDKPTAHAVKRVRESAPNDVQTNDAQTVPSWTSP